MEGLGGKAGRQWSRFPGTNKGQKKGKAGWAEVHCCKYGWVFWRSPPPGGWWAHLAPVECSQDANIFHPHTYSILHFTILVGKSTSFKRVCGKILVLKFSSCYILGKSLKLSPIPTTPSFQMQSRKLSHHLLHQGTASSDSCLYPHYSSLCLAHSGCSIHLPYA